MDPQLVRDTISIEIECCDHTVHREHESLFHLPAESDQSSPLDRRFKHQRKCAKNHDSVEDKAILAINNFRSHESGNWPESREDLGPKRHQQVEKRNKISGVGNLNQETLDKLKGSLVLGPWKMSCALRLG